MRHERPENDEVRGTLLRRAASDEKPVAKRVREIAMVPNYTLTIATAEAQDREVVKVVKAFDAADKARASIALPASCSPHGSPRAVRRRRRST